MKKLKDFMPSDESEVIDLQKMQGPPDKESAEAMKTRKSWGKVLSEKKEARKAGRDKFSSVAEKGAKNAGNYGARMKRYDNAIKQMDKEDTQSSNDSVKAWEYQMKNPSKSLKEAMSGISGLLKKASAKAKPLRKASGGLIRGAGSARGIKPYRVR